MKNKHINIEHIGLGEYIYIKYTNTLKDTKEYVKK